MTTGFAGSGQGVILKMYFVSDFECNVSPCLLWFSKHSVRKPVLVDYLASVRLAVDGYSTWSLKGRDFGSVPRTIPLAVRRFLLKWWFRLSPSLFKPTGLRDVETATIRTQAK